MVRRPSATGRYGHSRSDRQKLLGGNIAASSGGIARCYPVFCSAAGGGAAAGAAGVGVGVATTGFAGVGVAGATVVSTGTVVVVVGKKRVSATSTVVPESSGGISHLDVPSVAAPMNFFHIVAGNEPPVMPLSPRMFSMVGTGWLGSPGKPFQMTVVKWQVYPAH